MPSTEYPPFQLGKSRFDQTTFYGRWRHFMEVIDPRTLFIQQDEAEWCFKILEKYKNGTLSLKYTDEQLWDAQRKKQAIYHPDTGEKIFMPFRMSGFVPFGAPIVVGLLTPNPSFAATIFWQWLNQSHNACVNYANRNATKETPKERFIAGYIGAVTSAVSIALGLGKLIKKAERFSPAKKLLIQRFVPFPAVAVASTCNVVLMRNNELSEGIDVVDEQNNVIGTSKVAARKALVETALTRMFLPAPILLIPPTLMHFIEKTHKVKYRPSLKLPINAFITTLSFGFALPIAIALFPQYSKIATSKLEKEIQEKTKLDYVLYNKGL